MSLDFANFEAMKQECPQAARYWRVGDRLYYLGVLVGIISVPALLYFPSVSLALVAVGSAIAFLLGIVFKKLLT
jgi:membrane protein YdbS with pleckstrin-like domain